MGLEQRGGGRTKRLGKEIWKYRELYLFLLPALFLLILFSYVPMYGVLMAFQKYKPGQAYARGAWVGLYNFQRFFRSTWAWPVIRNTLYISIVGHIISWPWGLLLALMLHNSFSMRLKKTVQNLTYIPHLLSLVILISIVNLFCANDTGVINIVLKKAGRPQINFFARPDMVMPLYVFSGIWQDMGYSAIMYLAALTAVSDELIEAAKLDGADKLRQIWHVQIPALLPTIMTLEILALGRIFSMGADKMLLLQTSLNLSASEIISTYTYKVGMENGQYPFSTAVGLFQNVVNLVMIVGVNAISRKLTDTSIF